MTRDCPVCRQPVRYVGDADTREWVADGHDEIVTGQPEKHRARETRQVVLWKLLPGDKAPLDHLRENEHRRIGGVRARKLGGGWALMRFLGGYLWRPVSLIEYPPKDGYRVEFNGETWHWEPPSGGTTEPMSTPRELLRALEPIADDGCVIEFDKVADGYCRIRVLGFSVSPSGDSLEVEGPDYSDCLSRIVSVWEMTRPRRSEHETSRSEEDPPTA